MRDVDDDVELDDNSRDAPLNTRDSRLLVTGGLVVLLAVIAIAALVRAIGG